MPRTSPTDRGSWHHFEACILGELFISPCPFPTRVLAQVAPSSPASVGRSIPFIIFHIFSSPLCVCVYFPVTGSLKSAINTALQRAGTWRGTDGYLHPLFTQPEAPVRLQFSFPQFPFSWLFFDDISSPLRARSSFLLSQGQAGLGFPNRSDRSLVTATVCGGNGGREGGGMERMQVGGGCKEIKGRREHAI